MTQITADKRRAEKNHQVISARQRSQRAIESVAKKHASEGDTSYMVNIVVIGMGYVGIPCAALLADVPGFQVTGVQ